MQRGKNEAKLVVPECTVCYRVVETLRENYLHYFEGVLTPHTSLITVLERLCQTSRQTAGNCSVPEKKNPEL